MALCEIRWQSQVLDKPWRRLSYSPIATAASRRSRRITCSTAMAMTIVSGSGERASRFMAQYPIAIVMPDGFHGFYTDNEQGPAYGKYHEEMIGVMERNFPLRAERSARAIGGLSMGGYDAYVARAIASRQVLANG